MTSDRTSLKVLLSVWQTLAAGGILGGLIWATTLPNWILRDQNQVLIEGNRLLPKQVVMSLIPLEYPQSFLQISPENIVRTLEAHAPIADVTVNRRLFPPVLTVQVQERIPVAIAIATIPGTPSQSKAVGFLDQEGFLIPFHSYPPQVRQFLKSPSLKVVGVLESYRSYWTSVYQIISHSSIKVMEVDFQDPANLILKTELGVVHLGSYQPHLTEQFKVLERMRSLSKQVNPNQITYIDLKNPANPSVQMYQIQPTQTTPLQSNPTSKSVKKAMP